MVRQFCIGLVNNMHLRMSHSFMYLFPYLHHHQCCLLYYFLPLIFSPLQWLLHMMQSQAISYVCSCVFCHCNLYFSHRFVHVFSYRILSMMCQLPNVPINKRYNCVFGQYSNALEVEIFGRVLVVVYSAARAGQC